MFSVDDARLVLLSVITIGKVLNARSTVTCVAGAAKTISAIAPISGSREASTAQYFRMLKFMILSRRRSCIAIIRLLIAEVLLELVGLQFSKLNSAKNVGLTAWAMAWTVEFVSTGESSKSIELGESGGVDWVDAVETEDPELEGAIRSDNLTRYSCGWDRNG